MITQEEYLKLKELYKHNSRWIAKDKSGSLYVFKVMPMKFISFWAVERCVSLPYLVGKPEDNSFTYIKWEDEKPTKILDLIQDYEKQEELKKKVIIPQFVANWIEDIKPCNSLRVAFECIALRKADNYDDPLALWIEEGNSETFAIAWIYGYVVEQEKLYTVRLTNESILIKDPEFNTFQLCKAPKEQIEGYEYKLTQSEIESVDPILMQLAEEVING